MSVLTLLLVLALGHFVFPGAASPWQRIAPKVMIISMWNPEAQIWHSKLPDSGLGNLSSISIHSPGFSMLYSCAYCTQDGSICQLTTGEGEINSAASMMALILSQRFDLRKTYFLLAGIAGINPRHGTLGSVALIRYAVQVALQYEIDSRSIPDDWPTGYISYGTEYPHEYPIISYGTEVFELNAQLQETAYALASKATLTDGQVPRAYRKKYAGLGSAYQMAARPPSVIKCDSATSDVYYSGRRLAEAFENTTTVWTNGTGVYCMSAQEDNATLEVLLRAAIQELVDFSRIMVLRVGSNFDRPPPRVSDWEHLVRAEQNGIEVAMDNVFNAGIEIVKGIIEDWDCSFNDGVVADNYIGDIWGSLGGQPDFGFGSLTNGERVPPGGVNHDDLGKREILRRRQLSRRPFGKM